LSSGTTKHSEKVEGRMGERIGKRICEKMGEKIGEKRYKGKREIVVYRVRSPGQIAENAVKYPGVRRKKMSLHGRQVDGDNCLGMSSGWHRL
jgi:hypothetical protein